MDELITSRQVQELLKLDRTTVYRMLNDGRLNGIKVGGQWRFSRQEVESLIVGARSAEAERPPLSTEVIPLHCIQAMQDVFAEIAQVGAVTTGPDGEPITKISNSCRFCNLILASPSGRRACVASWRRLASQQEKQPKFVSCHAGLQYARARIEVEGSTPAMLIAGQFYAHPAEPTEEAGRIHQLAQAHGLNYEDLNNAAQALPVLNQRLQAQIGKWLQRVAFTFETVGRERADLQERLRRIAALSSLETD